MRAARVYKRRMIWNNFPLLQSPPWRQRRAPAYQRAPRSIASLCCCRAAVPSAPTRPVYMPHSRRLNCSRIGLPASRSVRLTARSSRGMQPSGAYSNSGHFGSTSQRRRSVSTLGSRRSQKPATSCAAGQTRRVLQFSLRECGIYTGLVGAGAGSAALQQQSDAIERGARWYAARLCRHGGDCSRGKLFHIILFLLTRAARMRSLLHSSVGEDGNADGNYRLWCETRLDPERDHATYKREVGMRGSGSVATTRPPITAYAIGPQNTVGAIGIIPRMAAAAVNRIRRSRCSVGTITAFHGC